jgi:Flp pilus assembly protein CpaB
MGGRSRTLILLGVVVLLGAVVVVVLMMRGGGGGAPATPTPEPLTMIVVAAQDIAQSQEILSGTVALRVWPKEQLPPGFLTRVEDAVGQYAKSDIPAGLPVLSSMIAPEYSRTVQPSELTKQIPAGKVAVALPVTRLSSVAYALKAGDHVDVLATYWVLDLDQDFQTKLVNKYLMASPQKDGGVQLAPVDPGGREQGTLFGYPVLEQPAEGQRARLVAQLTVQNMVVLGVGDWLSQVQPAEAAPTPIPGQPTPAPVEATAPDIITVVVDPQDALVLKFLRESGAVMDLALRSLEDTEQTFATESVTLQYMFTRFAVTEPPKLKYGVEPAPPATPTPVP